VTRIGAVARLDHVRRHFARQVQQAHDIHLKNSDRAASARFQEKSPTAADRVVDQDIRRTMRLAYVATTSATLGLARDIADHRMGFRKLPAPVRGCGPGEPGQGEPREIRRPQNAGTIADPVPGSDT